MEQSFKEFLYFNKNKIIGFIMMVIVLGGGFGTYLVYSSTKKVDADEKDIAVDKNIEEKKEDNKEEINENVELCFFDIKGNIKTPGVYSIDCDKRIIDAINQAGGLSKNADTSVINLSKKIEDGMVIKIYSKYEINNYEKTKQKEETILSICTSEEVNNDACISTNKNSSAETSKININTASLEELQKLTGIGEAKAKSIIEYRTKTPFKSIEDIKNVDGIGDSLYASIKENITI